VSFRQACDFWAEPHAGRRLCPERRCVQRLRWRTV